jgi:hypothetical protein
MMKLTLGDLHLASTGRTVSVIGQSATKTADLRGTAELFSVYSPAWAMTIAHSRWDNGNQDIRLHDRGTAPPRFDRFRSTARLGLTPAGADEYSVELMQAQMGENDHPSLRKVDLAELSLGADCNVAAVLSEMGAKVGTRASLIGDTSRQHGSRYCARFPCHATEVAVVAYVFTRIAPFHRQIRAWPRHPTGR